MSSNFNFYVNRQGVQGKRGAKGEQGFSPVISVESQTANEYILKVENEDGSFTTPNLRGNAIENNGGTYIRFNPETEQMYTGFADGATTEQAGVVRMGTLEDLVAGESEELVPNVADVHDFVQNSIGDISGFVTTSDFNAYTTTTDAALLSLSTNKLNTSTYDAYVLETASTLNGLSTNKLDASTFTSYTTATDAAIGALDTNKLDFTDLANTLVQGSNVTLTTDAVNKTITISSSGGGGGGTQVQSNWAETDNTDPSFIQNKPALGTMAAEDASDYTPTAGLSDVAISGSYNDLLNKPTIPAAQVNSDWNQSDNTAVDFIKNKPTIPAAANNATITITQGGVTKGSFTTNQATNATIDIDAGGGSPLLSGNGININQSNEIGIVQDEQIEYNWDVIATGSPTEVDGVYSGFSTSDYLTFGHPTSSITSYELSLDFETDNITTTWQPIIGASNSAEPYFHCTPIIYIDSSGHLIFSFTEDGTSSSRVTITSSSLLTANKEYKLHINWLNNNVLFELTDKSNSSVETQNISASAMIYSEDALIGTQMDGGSYFNGSIDLKNSYLKINGNLFNITASAVGDSPAKATSSLYGLVKPDEETITVNNGVISTVNMVQSSTVNNIVQITQTAYDALATKDANTLYVIIPASS